MRRWATLAAAAALAACTPSAEPAPAPSSAPSAAARWVVARPADAAAVLEMPAVVVAAPHGRAAVAPPLRARVLGVPVQVGATVAAGAPLVIVALPEAATAAAEYLAAVEQLAPHERRAARLGALHREGLARTGELEDVEVELARLRGARDLAAATLRAAGLPLGEARALVASGGRVPLRAPIAGVVTAVTAIVGASATPEAVLVELAAGAATRLEARLARPLPAEAALELVADDGEPIAATLVALAPVQDPDGTTRAWLELAAPAPAGATGRLRARLAPGAAALVPAGAIGRDAAGTFVWRREAEPRRVAVRVLATSGGDAVVDGIAAGDAVLAVAAAAGAPP